MKYIEGFRNPDAASVLREHLFELAAAMDGRKAAIMEVCGSHTMAIARYGIRSIIPENINLISGPGCPVCVTSPGYIDAAIELAQAGITIATFGDMMHVPGSDSSLSTCRAEGGKIEICYGPAAAIEHALRNPDKEVVFLAIGFETTIAPVVTIVDKAIKKNIKNISILTAFKLVPPALTALLSDPEIKVDAFLCPAHVSAVIGSDAYKPLVETYNIPCVVAGFEPLDILFGLEGILRQLISGSASVDNQYSRIVKPEGNTVAQGIIRKYLEPIDACWRGIGVIPESGLALRKEFDEYDAARRFNITINAGREHPACKCGNVIKGIMIPTECPMFGNICSPDNPIGPCMVSTEGSCAAYFKYSRIS